MWGSRLLDPLPACPFPPQTTHGPSRQGSAAADTPRPTSQYAQHPAHRLVHPGPVLWEQCLAQGSVQCWCYEPLLRSLGLALLGSGRALCFSCPILPGLPP